MDEPPISRGFRARRPADDRSGRIPPGQHLVDDFPVLSAGPTPVTDLMKWSFTLSHNRTPLGAWRWPEFEALTQTELTCDIHCVTTWSKLDTKWRGVTFDTLFEAAGLREPPGPFAMFHCDGGYTTNVPVADLIGGKGMIATRYDGGPLPAPHGGPARGLVPHLYFWKSAKWVRGIEFLDRDEPGFWEQLGYNMYGDPWREQRYTGD